MALFASPYRYKKRLWNYMILGCLVFGGAGFFYVVDNDEMTHSTLAEKEDLVSMAEHKNEATSPHFQAVDKKGQPYVISAEKASLKEDDDAIMLLTTPAFHMALHNHHELNVNAKEGVFVQNKKHISLKGSVHVEYGANTVFDMPMTEIDLNTGSLHGNESIKGHMDEIFIEAGRFEIYDRGAKIILTHQPVVRFHGKK